jgi:hypothetical protein
MTSKPSTTFTGVRVAIDVAKLTHQVLLELPSGQRRAMRIANRSEERGPSERLHGSRSQDSARRVRRGHHRHRVSPLPGSDETRREDPFAEGRRGACDLVDNARTFHLEYDALLSPVRAGRSWTRPCVTMVSV